MRDKVLRWCQENALFAPGQTVVCAVSGGADSVTMLHLLRSLQRELGVTVSAAHFNHRLRGAESDRDEAFVRKLCADWGVPLAAASGDAAARARETGESIEEAARNLRYAFFASLGQSVATAHTADDNLETILLNFLRGTGLTGLGGIPPKRDFLVRPILCCTRQEVLAYLDEHRLPHAEDSTNAADDCVRNRLRHNVLPLLKAENPSLAETALRTAQLLRQDDGFLDRLAETALQTAGAGPLAWRCAPLAAEPGAVRTRAVRRMLQAIRIPKLSHAHIEAVDRLLFTDDPSARTSLPNGWEAQREYGRLRLARTADTDTFAPVPLSPRTSVHIPELGLVIRCEFTKNFAKNRPGTFTFACRCDMIGATNGLLVRPRRTGDTIRLPGGTKTLKKWFIDWKIPAARRGLVPVLADEAGVLAVYGLGQNLDRAAAEGEPAILFCIEKE